MKRLLPILLILALLAGCASPQNTDDTKNTFKQISQEEAKRMMELDDGHVVVDVRRQDEYDAGHIPGAILIPNESIDTERPAELPDPDQVILIYCRRGNRSKEAASKLADMGYTNIYEFGGINEWTGDVVTSNAKATLEFDSFDGGGPDFEVILDSDIVSYKRVKEHTKKNYKELNGSPFTITYTFTGEKPGEATMIVKESSPIGVNLDHYYNIKVDNDLNVTIEFLTTEDLNAASGWNGANS